ncbi:MAG: hypothetical protein PWQ86_1353 [Bacillota bacterium]|jgi:hypothetical protein|nr:hypothetical protein [Bacillota bacterium]
MAAFFPALLLLAATGILLSLGRRRLDVLRRRAPQGAARLAARRHLRRGPEGR